MNRGNYVNFKNLSSTVELKELNRVLNDIMKTMWERLDMGDASKTYIFTDTVHCAAGSTVTVNYGVEFIDLPTVMAYSADGQAVIIDGTSNTNTGTGVRFVKASVSGNISIFAKGRIKI